MQQLLILLLGISVIGAPSDITSVDQLKHVSPRIQRQYDEVTHSFAIEGVPIHPLIIDRYFTSPSDFGPDLISVNLTEALRCNDTYGWDVELKHSWEPLEPHQENHFPEEWKYHDCENTWVAEPAEGRIGYRRIGVLNDDIQIIQHFYKGGGTASWHSIFLLQPKIRTLWEDYMGTWSPKHILELQLVGISSYTRINDEYTLQENRITIQELTETGPNNYTEIFDPFDIWIPETGDK